jgi:hypothetical protein
MVMVETFGSEPGPNQTLNYNSVLQSGRTSPFGETVRARMPGIQIVAKIGTINRSIASG